MRLGDVVDQLLDEHRLADAGAAEQTDLAALAVRREQVDDLDAGLEDLDLRALLDELRRRAVDRRALLGSDRARLPSTGSPTTFRMRPRHSAPTGIEIGAPVFLTSMPRTRPSVESIAIARTEPLAEVLRHLEHQVVGLVADRRVGQRERGQQRRQLAGRELDVDDRADDLGNLAAFSCAMAESLSYVAQEALALECFGAADDLRQLGGDRRLARAVGLAASAARSCPWRCGSRCPSPSCARRARRRPTPAARGRSRRSRTAAAALRIVCWSGS